MATSGTPCTEPQAAAEPGHSPRRPVLTPRLKFFLVSSFLLPLGSFMVLPFMSVFLRQRLGFSMSVVGLVIGAASLVQFSGGMVGGIVAERAGLRRTMLAGLTVRAGGFLLFALSPGAPALAVAALLLTAAGDALYTPANKAYVVQEAGPDRRPLVLSLTNSAQNSGMAVGPLISGLFIMTAPVPVFVCVTAVFTGVAVAHAVLLAPDRPVPRSPDERREVLARALLKPPMLVGAFGTYVYMFFQNYLVVYLSDRHSAGAFSLVLLVNTVLVITIQPLASGWIGRLRFRTATVASFALFGAGLALVGVCGLVGVFAGTVFVSLGEVIIFLKCDLTALDQLPDRPAAAVGTVRMAEGLGALASGAMGGQLYAVTADPQGAGTPVFWLVLAAQSAALAAGAALASRRASVPGTA
ncbi:MFS transporter [Streptomyces sp. NPDC048479]|uniref:MFS transporter n=1 Tax=Streptomyces sp. NPDC048479 TaxID=3154725 RepID=UPI00343ED37C